MGHFTKKEQVVILVLIIAMLGLLGYNIKYKAEPQFKSQDHLNDEDTSIQEEKADDLVPISYIEPMNQSGENKVKHQDKGDIYIHIGGEVLYPGVVKLKEGARLIDGVTLAGGPTQEADLNLVNLAEKLEDASKVYIPKQGEMGFEEKQWKTSSNPLTNGVEKDPTKININTATLEELKSLSGIGEAIAQRIIEFRLVESFKRIEDIKRVSGIGEKKFEAIQDTIVVE